MAEREIERKRLVELLDIIIQPGQKTLGDIADYLLTNGVIVPPCKVGDTVYFIHFNKIESVIVEDINYSFKDKGFILWLKNDDEVVFKVDYDYCIGYKLFTTHEEALKALKGGVEEWHT